MTENVDINSIIPLYRQIADQLHQSIEKGQFGEAGRLPTEAELCDYYNVSRITIRNAIEDLVIKGYVEKKQGKGTFLRKPVLSRRLDSGPMSFSEMCAENGLEARAEIIEAGIVVPKSAYVKDLLNLNSSDSAVRIYRLRYAGDTPLVLEDNFFPLNYAYLLSIDLEHESIYHYLREAKKVLLRSVSMKLRIVRADSHISKLLRVRNNAPQLELRGYVVNQNSEPVHSSHQIGYGENFEFVVR